MTESRLEYIDALKGVSILVVCLFHFESGVIPDVVNMCLNFAVPSFYFATGWLYYVKGREWNVRATFRRRLCQLGKPYLWFSCLLLCVTVLWVSVGHLPLISIPKEIFKTVCLRGIGTLWFIPALGIGEVIFCWLMSKKKTRHISMLILFTSITLIADYLYTMAHVWIDLQDSRPILNSIIYPWICVSNAWYLIYVGYWCSRYASPYLTSERTVRRRLLVGAIGMLLLALNVTRIVFHPASLWLLCKVIYTVLPSLGLICLFYALSGSMIVSFFSYWGFNSLVLMCTHYTITLEACKMFDAWITGGGDFTGPRTLVYLAICILLTYPMVYLFKTHLPFFLGQKSEKT